MDKQQMQQTIIMLDKSGQKTKRGRMISYMIFFSVLSFIFFRKNFPTNLFWEDFLGSIVIGIATGFFVPLALSFYFSMSDIQISYPEDRELAYWLKTYEDKFGEDFIGPWTR